MHQYFVEYSVRLQKIIESLKLEAELEKSEENLRGTMIIMKPGESQWIHNEQSVIADGSFFV